MLAVVDVLKFDIQCTKYKQFQAGPVERMMTGDQCEHLCIVENNYRDEDRITLQTAIRYVIGNIEPISGHYNNEDDTRRELGTKYCFCCTESIPVRRRFPGKDGDNDDNDNYDDDDDEPKIDVKDPSISNIDPYPYNSVGVGQDDDDSDGG